MSRQARTATKFLSALALLISVMKPAPALAWEIPCDFLTGGGFIIFQGSKANFGVGGGCKHGSPTWGHLEYIDHGSGLNVHWTSITGYMTDGDTSTDPKTGQPIGARYICGTARTNLPAPNDNVNFVVRAGDAGEPGPSDTFDISLRNQTTHALVYATYPEHFCYHYLGSSVPCSPGSNGGGNIQLHKPNPSTTGDFGGFCDF